MPDDLSADKPLLNIISGPDPLSRGLGGMDHLWFELRTEAQTGLPPKTNGKEPTIVMKETTLIEPQQKKLKVRSSVQQSMADLIGNMQ
jgi:hypothetical protein